MKTSQIFVISLVLLIALGLAFLIPPTQTAQSTPMLALTFTPSSVPPTETVAPPPPPTATPAPKKNDEDPKPPAPDILPPAGMQENTWTLGLPAGLPANLPGRAVKSEPMTLFIPSLGINASVKPIKTDGYSWDIRFLGAEVGWLVESQLPGERGNTVLVGHLTDRSGQPPFKNLDKLETGRLVVLSTLDAEYYYEVKEQQVVAPDDLSVIAPSTSGQLTLITCANWNQALKTYASRRVVIAELVRVYPKRR
jgi:LPXTG-site transpeptidase (sortase) family protein